MTSDAYRKLRKNLRLTQTALAQLLELHQVTIARRETGALPIPREAELALRHLECLQKPVSTRHTR